MKNAIEAERLDLVGQIDSMLEKQKERQAQLQKTAHLVNEMDTTEPEDEVEPESPKIGNCECKNQLEDEKERFSSEKEQMTKDFNTQMEALQQQLAEQESI